MTYTFAHHYILQILYTVDYAVESGYYQSNVTFLLVQSLLALAVRKGLAALRIFSALHFHPTMESAPYDERGTLHAEQGSSATRFIGSSSGVHFSNTVVSAFAPSLGYSAAGSGAFDHVFLVREEDGAPREVDNASSGSKMIKIDDSIRSMLFPVSSLPSQHETISYLRRYFQSWHLILPFLNGKELLAEVKRFYITGDIFNQDSASLNTISHAFIFSAIFRSVISLSAELHASREGTPSNGQGKDPRWSRVVFEDDYIVMSYLPHLMRASKWDSLGAVQAVAALQLYLVSTFRLRTAHQLGGTAIRLAQDAGLHRCPSRFQAFANNSSMCSMRKRVWHSIISLDRFTSQQLGLPLSVREQDYDVCELGSLELHVLPKTPADPITPENRSRYTNGKVLNEAGGDHVGPNRDAEDAEIGSGTDEGVGGDETRHHTDTSRPEFSQMPPPTRSDVEEQDSQRESAAKSFARLQSLNARAAETFNQSVAQRRVSPEMVQTLRGDLDRWWNEMSYDLPHRSSREASAQQQAIFFRISYHSALLNLERPILTRRPGSPTFSAAMQAAIRSSREIINDLSSELFESSPSSQTFSLSTIWPGFVRATYLASLVLAYGAQTKEFPRALAAKDMARSIAILDAFGVRWHCARSQASAVQVLLNEVQKGMDPATFQNSPSHRQSLKRNSSHLSRHSDTDQQRNIKIRSNMAGQVTRTNDTNGAYLDSPSMQDKYHSTGQNQNGGVYDGSYYSSHGTHTTSLQHQPTQSYSMHPHSDNERGVHENGVQQQQGQLPLFARSTNNTRTNGLGANEVSLPYNGVDNRSLPTMSDFAGNAGSLVGVGLPSEHEVLSPSYLDQMGTLQSWEALLAHAEGFLSPLYD